MKCIFTKYQNAIKDKNVEVFQELSNNNLMKLVKDNEREMLKMIPKYFRRIFTNSILLKSI